MNNDNLLENFIARGSVFNFEAQLDKKNNFKNVSFDFFADKSDILIKKIYGSAAFFKIKEGDLKLSISKKEISLETNFPTIIKYKKNDTNTLEFMNNSFFGNFSFLDAELKNYLLINFDRTYKVKNYDYKANGKINKANLKFDNPINHNYFKEKIKELLITNSQINSK